ncbi:hypothetical protein GY45DRAFT_1324110 [Cubamyces sp. BRFM 1775]|nr:hypothetical protein GY45DRAFT_1324110 [Cubamyces sp. BRFM 1775]
MSVPWPRRDLIQVYSYTKASPNGPHAEHAPSSTASSAKEADSTAPKVQQDAPSTGSSPPPPEGASASKGGRPAAHGVAPTSAYARPRTYADCFKMRRGRPEGAATNSSSGHVGHSGSAPSRTDAKCKDNAGETSKKDSQASTRPMRGLPKRTSKAEKSAGTPKPVGGVTLKAQKTSTRRRDSRSLASRTASQSSVETVRPTRAA